MPDNLGFLERILGLWLLAAIALWGSIWKYAHNKADRAEVVDLRHMLQSSNEDKDREFAEVGRRFDRMDDRLTLELHRLADGQDEIKHWLIERGKP